MTPASAHHQKPNDGPIRGIAIAAISHGEMPVVANYRSQILDLAARQPVTDPILRRLSGFVSLQYFACFWGLVPGSLTDEQSPFNECSHAYLAGARALIAHMAAMPGNQSAAKELQERIKAEIAADPNAAAVCSNSSQTFDSADVIGPDWQLAPRHAPTVLTFSALAALFVMGLAVARRRMLRAA
ncbi:hypothetical protein [Bradyrhizobium sp.]|uniref:hypothetical protein n=1 Tax=Bradyrhizobium sp. TaxID=376 RepID=UPI00261A0441|nr:hypothetical protein [Bradyrhizobium sp.]